MKRLTEKYAEYLGLSRGGRAWVRETIIISAFWFLICIPVGIGFYAWGQSASDYWTAVIRYCIGAGVLMAILCTIISWISNRH